jgi:hypothetical protein
MLVGDKAFAIQRGVIIVGVRITVILGLCKKNGRINR